MSTCLHFYKYKKKLYIAYKFIYVQFQHKFSHISFLNVINNYVIVCNFKILQQYCSNYFDPIKFCSVFFINGLKKVLCVFVEYSLLLKKFVKKLLFRINNK